MKIGKYLNFSLKDTLISIAVTAIAITASCVFYENIKTNINMIFILAVILISRLTTGYFYGLVAAGVSVLSVNCLFAFPYGKINFLLEGYPVTYITMFIVAIVTSALTTALQRQVQNARESEQKTRELFEQIDLGLPDMDGLDILKSVRQWSAVPIIVVSARGLESDKVEALDLGADDYITKPFGTGELLARIRTALRHSMHTTDVGTAVGGSFKLGDFEINYDKMSVLVSGETVKLTQIEFKIISLLSKYAGKVLTYDFLMKNIWGPYAPKDNRILRVNMANIRRKIEVNPAEPKYIFTEVGVGYRMTDE